MADDTRQGGDQTATTGGGASTDRGGRDAGLPGPADMGDRGAGGEAVRPDEARSPVGRGGRIDIDGDRTDRVQEALEESFPASDPPTYSPPRTLGPPPPRA